VKVTQEIALSAEQLIRALSQRGVPLPADIGAFITLEMCEVLLDRPAQITARDVRIDEIGEVSCSDVGSPTTQGLAVDALIGLLSDLLVCAGPAVPKRTLELLTDIGQDPERTVAALMRELEACLMPLNRGATRRVIARLVREAHKPISSQDAAVSPKAAELDAQLDALLDEEPEAGPILPSRRPRAGQRHDLPERGAGEAAAPLTLRTEPSERARAQRVLPAEVSKPARRARGLERYEEDPAVAERSARASAGMWVFGISTLGAIGLLLVYFTLGQRDQVSALGRLPPSAAESDAAPRRAYGDLVVNSRPARAQVLLSIGTGPATATDIPLGLAHEFVAIAEGYQPARAILPADAVWDEVDGQPRYELAIQASRERPNSARLGALGPTLLPRDLGAPQGRTGSVRLVTTPRGAKVYQLIGFTPEVRVENLALDRSYELLVYLEGKPPVTQQVTPAAFQEQNGKRVAVVDVSIPSRSN